MRCMYCGAELNQDSRFCGNCGRVAETLYPTDGATSRSDMTNISDMRLAQQRGQPTPLTPASASSFTPYTQPPTYYPQMQPTPPPPPPPMQQENLHPRPSRHPVMKVALIVASIVVVAGAVGVGLLLYFINLPQPVISLSSAYQVDGNAAGAIGTSLHISGQKFSANSVITFLLDNSPLTGGQVLRSDASGNITATLTITSDWSDGRHTITARDAGNNLTKVGVAVVIVPQGQAHTPGPNGAPPDDASFKVNIAIKATLQEVNQPFNQNGVLIVTGHADPNGGTVCQVGDNGQPQVSNETTVDSKEQLQETATYSCSGTYKGGKITYTETLTSDQIVYSSGATCTLTAPTIDEQIVGSYINNAFVGTATYPKLSSYTCMPPGTTFFHYGAQGNWTGSVTNS